MPTYTHNLSSVLFTVVCPLIVVSSEEEDDVISDDDTDSLENMDPVSNRNC